MTPLEKLNSLDRDKHSAFLAFCTSQARGDVVSFNGKCPHFGKAECQWLDDWREFWERELPALGFTTFAEGEPKPALGMVAGSTFTEIQIHITAEGWEAREAYWAAFRDRSAANSTEERA